MVAGSELARQDVMKDNIILSNHREVLDYRTNPKFSQRVDITTKYVAGTIALFAHPIYITAQLSIRAARGVRKMAKKTLQASFEVKQLYQEREIGTKLTAAFETVKNKLPSAAGDRAIADAIEADLQDLEVEPKTYVSESRSDREEAA
ncbi:MAG: hypothetical protein AAFX40_19280, partial [Cyanobacteria bacterium J06639_1]